MKSTVVLLALASVAPVFAALMLHTETTISKPVSGQTVTLEGLVYKARFEAKVTAVHLAVKSEAGADPVIGVWTFTGSNSDGQVHRVVMEIRLLDERASKSESSRPTIRFRLVPGTSPSSFP